MRAHASLVSAPQVEPGGLLRLERMAGEAPVAWRQAGDAVYLVGTSASPVGDDDVVIDVRARSGSQLAVRSTAATVAWTGVATRHQVRAVVEAGATLDWTPEPLVVTSACRHVGEARVDVADGGSLRWREILVLGRHREEPGFLLSCLVVDVGERPLLRHDLAVGADGWNGPAVLGSARVVGLLLHAGVGASAEAGGAYGTGSWAVTPLEGPGVLAYAIGDTVAEVGRRLDAALTPS